METDNKGFTLIEILITLCILSIFIIATTSVNTHILRYMSRNSVVFSMAKTAQGLMEELKASNEILIGNKIYTLNELMNQTNTLYTEHETLYLKLYPEELEHRLYVAELLIIDKATNISYSLSAHVNYFKNHHMYTDIYEELPIRQ